MAFNARFRGVVPSTTMAASLLYHFRLLPPEHITFLPSSLLFKHSTALPKPGVIYLRKNKGDFVGRRLQPSQRSWSPHNNVIPSSLKGLQAVLVLPKETFGTQFSLKQVRKNPTPTSFSKTIGISQEQQNVISEFCQGS